MKSDPRIEKPELEALFDRYREAPTSHVFAPLADACRKAGMLEEAIQICDKGVAENPGYTSGHVVRGKCYYDSGMPKEAKACFERVLEMDPNNLVALKYLGILAAEAGDAEAARERFRHILALDPENRDIVDQLEAIETREEPAPAAPSGESDDAVALEEILDEDFEGKTIVLGDDEASNADELATMTLADIYASQGYTDKALRIYHEVLRRQPGNQTAREKVAALTGEALPAPEPARAPADAGEPAFEEIPARGEPARRSGGDPAATATTPAFSSSQREKADDDNGAVDRPRIQDGKSYEQFKRWLKNMSR